MRGIGRLKNLVKRVITRPLSRSLILLYHRVVSLQDDPQKLCVSPENFDAHLRILKQYLHPISLRQLNSGLQNRCVINRGVAITFDDGYADNLLYAKPILEKHNVPATVFVVSDWVGSQREFFWDDLARILFTTLKLPDSLEIEINGLKESWDLTDSRELTDASLSSVTPWNVEMPGNPTPEHRLYRELTLRLRDADSDTRERVLVELCKWAGIPRNGRNEQRALTIDELRALVVGGLIEVGAHTKTHVRLSMLSANIQKQEIFDSKKELETLLGQPVTSFSYPFGGLDDYNNTSIKLAKEAGFACVCSNFQGPVHRWSDPFQLPRFLVRNWDGEEFERQLLAFLDS